MPHCLEAVCAFAEGGFCQLQKVSCELGEKSAAAGNRLPRRGRTGPFRWWVVDWKFGCGCCGCRREEPEGQMNFDEGPQRQAQLAPPGGLRLRWGQQLLGCRRPPGLFPDPQARWCWLSRPLLRTR